MKLENISQKQLSELENSVRTLLVLLRKVKLQGEPVMEPLQALEKELGEARRKRFDANNSEYHGY